MKIYKKILIIFLIIVSFTLCTNQVLAAIINPDDYDPSKKEVALTIEEKQIIVDKVGGVLAWIRNIAIIVSVISLMLIGLKYIMGSVNEKAKYKETLIPWFIGCVVAVLGTTMVSYIYQNVT